MQQIRAKLDKRTEANKVCENPIKCTVLRDWILDFMISIADDALNRERPVGSSSSGSPHRVQAGGGIQPEVGEPRN